MPRMTESIHIALLGCHANCCVLLSLIGLQANEEAGEGVCASGHHSPMRARLRSRGFMQGQVRGCTWIRRDLLLAA